MEFMMHRIYFDAKVFLRPKMMHGRGIIGSDCDIKTTATKTLSLGACIFPLQTLVYAVYGIFKIHVPFVDRESIFCVQMGALCWKHGLYVVLFSLYATYKWIS